MTDCFGIEVNARQKAELDYHNIQHPGDNSSYKTFNIQNYRAGILTTNDIIDWTEYQQMNYQ